MRDFSKLFNSETFIMNNTNPIYNENTATIDNIVYIAHPASSGCFGCDGYTVRSVCEELPFCGKERRIDRIDVIFLKANNT